MTGGRLWLKWSCSQAVTVKANQDINRRGTLIVFHRVRCHWVCNAKRHGITDPRWGAPSPRWIQLLIQQQMFNRVFPLFFHWIWWIHWIEYAVRYLWSQLKFTMGYFIMMRWPNITKPHHGWHMANWLHRCVPHCKFNFLNSSNSTKELWKN